MEPFLFRIHTYRRFLAIIYYGWLFLQHFTPQTRRFQAIYAWPLVGYGVSNSKLQNVFDFIINMNVFELFFCILWIDLKFDFFVSPTQRDE